MVPIIPYQELSGGYNIAALDILYGQRLYHTKNYQGATIGLYHEGHRPTIIPYQELPGGYTDCTKKK